MHSLSLATTSLEDALLPCMDSSDVSDCIAVMLHQEQTTYRCDDYLAENADLLKRSSKPVDEECRVKMCEWCYQVVDFCKFRRETVSIGMAYLDKFLSTEFGRKSLGDRKEYQLAAMTSLYMAIKLHEPLEMETSLLADLSRGCYTELEFVAMEQKILRALKWRLNGPTPLCFVQHIMALLPESVHPAVAGVIMDYARYQTELAVADHCFVKLKPSEIALAAVLNAVEGMDTNLFPLRSQGKFLRAIERYTGMMICEAEATQSCLSLILMSVLSEEEEKTIDAAIQSEDSDEDYETRKHHSQKFRGHSPVSVARSQSRRKQYLQ